MSNRFASLLESLLEKTRVVLLLFSRLPAAERRDTAPIHTDDRMHEQLRPGLDLFPAVRIASRAGTARGEVNHLLTCPDFSTFFYPHIQISHPRLQQSSFASPTIQRPLYISRRQRTSPSVYRILLKLM